MARIKPTIWSISDEVAPLVSVNIRGEIHDIHGCFTICHNYVTRKEKLNKPQAQLDFHFYIFDPGLVTGFKGVFCDVSSFTSSFRTMPVHLPFFTPGFFPDF